MKHSCIWENFSSRPTAWKIIT